MMTQFEKGDLVVAKVTAQGMVKGETYEVLAVGEMDLGMIGVFVTYYLRPAGVPNGPTLAVGNGHLLLELADDEDRDNAEEAESRGRNGLLEDDDLDAIHQGIQDDESELQMRERDDHWSKV